MNENGVLDINDPEAIDRGLNDGTITRAYQYYPHENYLNYEHVSLINTVNHFMGFLPRLNNPYSFTPRRRANYLVNLNNEDV